MSWRKGELLWESEWLRVYRFEDGQLYESKFVTDGLTITPEDLGSRWPVMSPEEKVHFAEAFVMQLTPQLDESVLNFLMEKGDPDVRGVVATRLIVHSDRDRVLKFLIERIQEEELHLLMENYYQALESIGDPRAIPALTRRYDNYRNRLADLQPQTDYVAQLLDYIACCRTLLALEPSEELRTAVEQMRNHPNDSVRAAARAPLG